MSQRTDWLPADRTGILAMGFNWNTALANNSAAWNIPPAVQGEFSPLVNAAEAALATEKDESTRTPVAAAQCKTAFDALIAKMRDIKKRYFYVPPLTDADLVSLGLKIPDHTPTPSGSPSAQATIETYLVGRHELGVKISYITGNLADAANKGYRIWYSVVAQGGTPPANPDDLRKSFFTKKKKDVIEFDFGDSGKTAWFAVQIENEGKKGPWGPLVSELIP